MQATKKYKYHYRLGYGSSDYLIEFFSGVEEECFIEILFKAITSINSRVFDGDDLWQNDEILLNIDSDYGRFIFSKDIWGLAFIMSDNNQKVIIEIDRLLDKSLFFDKIEVNLDDYK